MRIWQFQCQPGNSPLSCPIAWVTKPLFVWGKDFSMHQCQRRNKGCVSYAKKSFDPKPKLM